MKKLEFEEIKGKTIVSADAWKRKDQSWRFKTNDGDYELYISDDGPQNDSFAYIESILGLESIIGKEIIEVQEESDSEHAIITLRAKRSKDCIININHQHNGYYGFSYELIPQK